MMRNTFFSLVLPMVLAFALQSTAHAQVINQISKLVASDGGVEDYFGESVAISGDYAVVGSYWDDDKGSNSGSAYVYYRNQGGTDTWGFVTKLLAPDGVANDHFGRAVAISGDYIVVGAYWDDDNGSNSGSGYVYYRNQDGTDAWGYVKKITASDGSDDDGFGRKMAMSGDYLVMSATGEDEKASNAGAVYIFNRNEGGADAWGQVSKLTASDGAADDNFGGQVSISGDYAVVGASGDDNITGSAYLYSRNQGGSDVWGEVTKLVADDRVDVDGFGNAVSISGDNIIIGSPYDDDRGFNSGSVYFYSRNQGGVDAWGQVTKINPVDGAVSDRFGSSVGLSGDYAFVGAHYDDENGEFSGLSYVLYRHEGGADAWGIVSKAKGNDTAQEDYLGIAVALSGDYAIAGAHGDDVNADRSGSAYIFEMPDASPTVGWTTGPSMPTAREGMASCASGGKLYVVGGENGGERTDLEIYDPATDSWTTGSSMPSARQSFAVGAIDGKLYALGGYHNGYLSTLEIYDTATNVWTTGPSMSIMRRSLVVGVIDGKLYAVGGHDGSSQVATLEIYDPATNAWTTGSAMPTARDYLASGVIDGKFYVIGGQIGTTASAVMEIYDPATNAWTTGPSMSTARYSLAADAIGGKLYVVGGLNGLNTLEIYSSATNDWITGPTMPTSRYAVAAGAISGKLYAVGGGAGGGSRFNTLEIYETGVTTVSGNIATTTWTAANSPYYVTGTVTVPTGNTLTIEPGVDVLFDVDVQFVIEGALNAVGTEADSIRFLKGTASEWGGIRISGGDSSTIHYARISDGHADGNAPDYSGGAVQIAGSRLGMSHTVLKGNDAEFAGGIYAQLSASIDLAECDIVQNTSHSGGGLFLSASTATLADCRIVGNSADLDAGGLYTVQSTITATRCDIEGNSAAEHGGGLYSYQSTLQISDCTITGNNVTNGGGGGLWLTWHTDADISGTLITDNTSNGDGAGAYFYDYSDITVTNCVVYGNATTSGTGGIHVRSDTDVSFANSIIWSNGSVELANESGTSTPLGAVGLSYCNLEGAIPGSISDLVGNINADPLFVDATGDDYSLQSGSPCIDAGDPASSNDPDGTRADIGAVYHHHTAVAGWTTGPSMPTAREGMASCTSGGKLYVVGGENGGDRTELEIYDPATDSWTTGSSMPTARKSFAMGAIDGKLYALGGYHNGILSTLEIYDTATNVWTTGPSMSIMRRSLVVGVVDGKLYAVGGHDGSSQVATLEIYDPATNAWTTGSAMPTARDYLASGVIDGKFYVVGGMIGTTPNAALEIYDPATNVWTTGPSMPSARFHLAAGVIGGKLYAVGGNDAISDALKTMVIYSPVTNDWITGPAMPTARYDLAAGAISGKLYAVGGGAGHGSRFNTLEIYETGITTVSGNLATSTWTAANSPYYVTGTVTVTTGNTLTIEPGVDVLFDVDVQFIVEGALNAVGTEADSIRFMNGSASEWGGLRFSGDNSNILSFVRISDASNDGSTFPDDAGGGISVTGSQLSMLRCIVSGNSAAGGGGAIALLSDAVISMDSCNISSNTTPYNGGGIFGYHTSMTLHDCEILSNTASIQGGGVYIAGLSTGTLTGTVVAKNTADRGAGLWVNRTDADGVSLVNCTIADNTAGTDAGAFYSSGTEAYVHVQSTILYGNSSATTGPITSFNYSNYQGTVYGGGGTGNVGGDPLFVDAVNGDYSLQAASPCINTGDPASSNDPDGTRPEMGASYFPLVGTWTNGTVMPTSQRDYGIGYVNGRFHMLAGLASESTHQVYDPAADTWSTAAPIPRQRYATNVATHDGLMYVAGGASGNVFLDIYNPSTNTWTTGADMLTSSAYGAIGVIDGLIYVAGGSSGAYEKKLQIYNPVSNTWSYGSEMPTERYTQAYGVVSGKLYVVGGYNSGGRLRTLEIYDPVTDAWTTGADLPGERNGAAAGVIDGKLYLVGGESDAVSPGDMMYVYDPVSDSWSIGPNMPTPRDYLVVGSLYEDLYTFGGRSTGSATVNTVEIFDTGVEISLISGSVTSTTWTAANSPYYVTGTVTVPTGNTLTIEPGVDVLFDADVQFVVQGALNAVGTEADSIRFVKDKAAEWGGIRFSGGDSSTIHYARISDGNADGVDPYNDGGAIYASGSGTRIGVQNAVISNNKSGSNGGGVNVVTGSTIYLRQTTLTGNSSWDGGAVSAYSGTIEMSDCWISGNTAISQAGALYGSSGGVLNLERCTIVDNESIELGSVIRAWQTTITLKYCTITGNTAGHTAAIFVDDLSFTSIGSIIWDNGPTEIHSNQGSSTINVTYSDVQGGYAGDGNINSNPLFSTHPDSTYRLTVASPCINTGDPASALDPDGTRADMGAFYNDQTGMIGWHYGADMPTARVYASVATVDSKTYVIGGNAAAVFLDVVEIYDPSTDTWTTGTPMPTPRGECATGVIDGKIYIAGGSNSNPMSTVEIYDPVADSWSTGAGMPNARYGLKGAVLNGKLYAMGGHYPTGNVFHATVSVYDPVADTWSAGTPMTTPRYSPGVATIGDKIFVASGENDGTYLQSIEVYDSVADTWTTRTATLPAGRSGIAAAALGGNLYLVGGATGAGQEDLLDIYDSVADAMSVGHSMPIPRSHTEAVTIGGKLYVPCGINSANTLSTLAIYETGPNPSVVNGNIATTTWTTANSPYYVTGQCTVATGNTLTIEPGVDVLFDADVQFIVQGTLEAVGTVTDSIRFMKGTAAEWGGIRISGDQSSTIAWTEISGGKAEGVYPNNFGGGVWLGDPDQTPSLTLQHCTIRDNSAVRGGGIHAEAQITIEDCQFLDNSATEEGGGFRNIDVYLTDVSSSVFAGNEAPNGAAMWLESPTVITSSTITGNTATGAGAIHANGTYVSLSMSNSIVWDNSSSEIYVDANVRTDSIRVSSSLVSGGIPVRVVDGTGNIDADPLFVDAANGDYSLKTGSPCIDAGDLASPNDPDGTRADMGALYFNHEFWAGDPLDVQGTVETTSWTAANSPYRVSGTVIIPSGNTLTIEPGVDVLFDADVQFIVEGVLDAVGTEADSIHFVKGTAAEWSGIRISGGDSSTIHFARISDGHAHDTSPYDQGGGIRITGSRLGLSNVVLSDNAAAGGGGINAYDGNTISLVDCTLRNNAAAGGGGGIGVYNSTVTVTGCDFVANTSNSGGGAFVYQNATTHFDDCTFSGNTVNNKGGGFYVYADASATLTNCTITDNSAVNEGGGLHVESGGTLVATDCTISGNTARDGGGIANNWASGDFVGNSVTLTGCTINGNSATSATSSYGGAFYNQGVNAVATLDNCVIFNNNADTHGGAIYNYNADATITNCTITGNAGGVGSSGALHSGDTAEATILNSILWNNSPTEIANPTGSVSATYSDIQGGYTGTGNIDADPLFVDAASGDYSLQAGSPSIDTGDPASPNDPDGTRADMGSVYYPQNTVSGTITSTTWTSAESPYYVIGTVTVPSGNTLTIDPGVDVLFDADVQFIVEGVLDAVGTEADSIRFVKGTAAEWGGIRIYENDSSTVKYARISDGHSSGADPDKLGGGIYIGGITSVISSSARLTLDHVVIEDNLSDSEGGGLWAGVGVTVHITDSRIAHNGCQSDGAGLRGNTGTIMNISRCVVSDNTANLNSTIGGGGGLAASGSIITMEQTTFYGNSAFVGGGLRLAGEIDATLRNTIVWESSPDAIGWTGQGTLDVTYSDIAGGYTGNGNIDVDPLFVDAANGDYSLQVASPCINMGDPDSNTDPDGSYADMGALPYDLSATPDVLTGRQPSRTLTLSEYRVKNTVTVPSGNTLTINPGVDVLFDADVQFKVEGVLDAVGTEADSIRFIANVAAGNAEWGGIHISGGDSSTIHYTRISDAQAISSSGPLSDGGGLSVSNVDTRISAKHCVWQQNAASNGGGVAVVDSAFANFEDCVYQSNIADFGNGGAVHVSKASASFTRCEFIGNATTYSGTHGGAIHANFTVGPPITLEECNFTSNSTTAVSNAVFFSHSSRAFMDGCVISGNEGGVSGAITVSSGIDSAIVEITNCTVADNSSPVALHARYFARVVVTNSILRSDGAGVAADNSGIIRIDHTNLTGGVSGGVTDLGDNIDTDPLFVDAANGDYSLQVASPCINMGDPASDPDPDGSYADIGALPYDLSATPDVLTGRQPSRTLTLSEYRVKNTVTVPSGNTLTIEPGVDVLFDADVQFIVEGVLDAVGTEADSIRFVKGTAAEWGGLRISGGDSSTIHYTCISDGNANGGSIDDWGGAIHVEDTGTALNIANSKIADNHANSYGGGLSISFATAWVTRTVFTGNSATLNGGGLHVSYATGKAYVDRCTFTGNNAVRGGGVFVTADHAAYADIHNSVLWGNSPNGLEVNAGVANVAYTDIQGGIPTGATDGTGNIDADPLFVDAAGGDYSLQPGSPCIDAGDPASPNDPDDSRADMGAIYHLQNTVSGTITTATWTAIASPYHVIGTVTVPSGNTLTIEPGVDVLFDADVQFVVGGVLDAIGTEVDSIRFILGTAPAWKGMRFLTSDSSTVSYTRFSGGDLSTVDLSGEESLGGALNITGPTARLRLDHSVIENCIAYGGGAVYVNDGKLYANDCRFSSDSTTAAAGAIYINNGGTAAFVRCDFDRNTAANGGAISLSISTATFTECVFTNNVARTGMGGALYTLNSTIDMETCQFTDNTAYSHGGAIYGKNSADIELTDCVFTGNSSTSSPSYGGAIHQETDGVLTATRCNISGNSASTGGGGISTYLRTQAQITSCYVTKNIAERQAGIRLNSNGRTDVTNCTIADNVATDPSNSYGGGIGVREESQFSAPMDSLLLVNCVLYGNTAPDIFMQSIGTPKALSRYSLVAGGVPADVTNGTGNIDTDPLFVDAANDNYSLQVNSPCINVGDPTSALDPDGTSADIGAYAYDLRDNPEILTGRLSTRTLTLPEYRVKGTVTVPAGETLTIDPGVDVLFDADVQFVVEGILHAVGTEADSIRFIKGTAAEWGGLRISGGDSSTITYTRISGGDADGAAYPNNAGGGINIRNVGATLAISDSRITGNYAHAGGGIMVDSARIYIARCEIIGNNSTGSGGGFAIDWDGTADIQDSRISGNQAAQWGGGLLLARGTQRLTRCVISENSANVRGSALSASYSANVFLDNCTIINNTGPIGAVDDLLSATLNVKNNIVWGNEAPQIVSRADSGPVIVTYSDIEGSFTGTGNIDTDPLFVDAANGDYSLSLESPCINVGDPTSALDSDGTSADIGAFSFDLTDSPEVLTGILTTRTLTLPEYRVKGMVTVPAGETLTINPGVDVLFDADVQFVVEGVLHAVGTEADSIRFIANVAAGNAEWGGLNISGGDSSTIAYLRISDGNADGVDPNNHGGGLRVSGVGTRLAAYHSVLQDNEAFRGGAIAILGSAHLILKDSQLLRNTSAGTGGGIYSSSASAEVDNCVIDGNRVINAGAHGGGAFIVQNNGTTTTFSNCVVTNNSAGNESGGIFFSASALGHMSRCIVANNGSNGTYGAITADSGPPSSVTVENCTVYGNTGGSGVSQAHSSVVTVRNSIIFGNDGPEIYGAPSVTYSDIEGGFTGTGNIDADPVFVDAANDDYSLQVSSPCINIGDPSSDLDSDDTVADIGAYAYDLSDSPEFLTGRLSTRTLTLPDYHVKNTITVPAGETLTIDPGVELLFDADAQLVVNGVLYAVGTETDSIRFIKGTAADWGGIRFYGGNSSTISWSEISGSNSGGVFAEGATVTLERCTISDNNIVAGQVGAGIVVSHAATMTLNWCLIVRNTGALNGGALYAGNGAATLNNCTINGNSATDGAGGFFVNNSATVNLENSILWGNTGGSYSINAGSFTANYSDIEGGYSGTGNIDADPLFIDAANGDYSLESASPSIDAANPASPLNPDGTRADMGAFFFTNQIPVWTAQADTIINEGTELSFTVSATDPDAQDLTYSMTVGPASAFTPADSTFRWTPAYDFVTSGSVSRDTVVVFTVNDGQRSVDMEVKVTVQNSNIIPVWTVQADTSVDEGTELSFTIAAIDTDEQVLTYSMTDGPAGAFTPADSTFRWTPPYDYVTAGEMSRVMAVVFEVTDGQNPVSMQVDVTVNHVNLPPIWTVQADTTINEGVELSFAVQAIDSDEESLAYSMTSGPVGAFTPADSTFRWTPPHDFVAALDASRDTVVVFEATDGQSQVSMDVTITVTNINIPPVWIAQADLSIDEGSELSFTIVATDADEQDLTYSMTSGPADAFTPADSTFRWTPPYDFVAAGDESRDTVVVFDVTDGQEVVSMDVEITVENVNLPPEWTVQADTTVDEGVELSFTIAATDADQQDLTYSMTSGPLDAFTPADSTFTWTPPHDFVPAGNESRDTVVTFDVTDGQEAVSMDVKITVGNVNLPPEWIAQADPSIDEGFALSFTVAATDADEQDLTYSMTSGPNGAFTPADSTFRWTPPYDYVSAGNVSRVMTVVFEVTDGQEVESMDVKITVTNVNIPPKWATQADSSIDEGTELSFIIAATDADEQDLTYAMTSGPAGAFTPADRTFRWTPPHDFVAADSEFRDTVVVFEVTDGQAYESMDVKITVGNINLPPEWRVQADTSINEGSELSFTIAATDPDGQDLTYSMTSGPFDAFDPEVKTFTWTPPHDFVAAGNVSRDTVVVFEVTDGQAYESMDIKITVLNVNQAPIWITITDQTAKEGIPLTFPVAATDDDGQILEYSLIDGPDDSFNPTDGTFSWIPLPDFVSDGNTVDSLTLKFGVTDGDTLVSMEVKVTVENDNRVPTWIKITDQTVKEGKLLTFPVIATDPDTLSDSQVLTYTMVEGAEGNFTPENRTYTWTPLHSFVTAGNPSRETVVTFEVSDGVTTVPMDVKITVENVNQAPEWITTTGQTAKEGKLLTFPVAATDDDGQKLVYSLIVGPDDSFTFTDSTFTWTPPYSFVSDDKTVESLTLTFGVTDIDGEPPVTMDVIITVDNVNQAPEWTDTEDRPAKEGILLTFDVAATDDDGQKLEYSLIDGPDDTFFTFTDSTFTWTPPYTFVSDGKTVDSLSLTFGVTDTDGGDPVPMDVIITVENINQAPKWITTIGQPATEGTELTFPVAATDDDGQKLEYSLIDGPDDTFFTFMDSTFTWTPPHTFVSDRKTVDSLTLKFGVTDIDGEPPVTMDVIITVENHNRVPKWTVNTEDLDTEAEEDELVKFSVSASDSDRVTDRQELKYSLVDPPAGAIIEPLTGLFTWTPTNSQIAEWLVTFHVEDDLEASPSDLPVSIKVLRSNDPPVLSGWKSPLENTESWDVKLTTSVRDDYGDDVGIKVEYGIKSDTDTDTTWNIASVTGDTVFTELEPGKEQNVAVEWKTALDLPTSVLTKKIIIKLTPYDSREVGEALLTTIDVMNLPCDWDSSGAISPGDFGEMALAWDDATRNNYKTMWKRFDIGPYSREGEVSMPNIVIKPDTLLNIHDLMTFTMLWDWAWKYGHVEPKQAARIANTLADRKPPISVSSVNERNGTADIRIRPPVGCRASRIQITFEKPGDEMPYGRTIQGMGGVGYTFMHRETETSSIEFWSILSATDKDTGIVLGELVGLPTNTASEISVYYDLVDAEGQHLETGLFHYTVPVRRIPKLWALQSVAPNPFNPSTTIRFDVPSAEPFSIHVYNAIGQRIATLADGIREPGAYSVTWRGLDDTNRAVGSGVYLIELRAAGVRKMKKMTLLR
jgi:parallel beta-helix repeat protein/predicted outer membrane repeat protein